MAAATAKKVAADRRRRAALKRTAAARQTLAKLAKEVGAETTLSLSPLGRATWWLPMHALEAP